MDLRKKQNLLIMGTSIKWALFFGPDSAHIREVLLYTYFLLDMSDKVL